MQPRASRTEVVGLHGAELRIRLMAPPVEGAANQALLEFLARQLDIPRGAVTLVSGAGHRSKVVAVRGCTPAEVMSRLGIGG